MSNARWQSLVLGGVLLLAGSGPLDADSLVRFGPRAFTRGGGKPTTETFEVAVPAADYRVRVESDGIASAAVVVNGVPIVGPDDFDGGGGAIERPVTLRSVNVFTVELRGARGGRLELSIHDVPRPSDDAGGKPEREGERGTGGDAERPKTDDGEDEHDGQQEDGRGDRDEGRKDPTVCRDSERQPGACVPVDPPGAFTLFGPRTFTRTTGRPVTETFEVAATAAEYLLRVESDGVASAEVAVNGASVLRPDDFDNHVRLIERPISLGATNAFGVQLRGEPGGTLRLTIIGVDLVPPTIRALVDRPANAAGWHGADVTVSFVCEDAFSGVETCPSPVVVSAEGADQVVGGEAVDRAGNRAEASVTLNVDKTPPLVTAAISPEPNAGGWNHSDVTVSFLCTDALSGVADCPAPVLVTAEGAGQAIVGVARDVAGNTASASRAVSLDKTAPHITASLDRPANTAGWHAAPVTVAFTCDDAGAGIVSCPAAALVDGEGANQVIGGEAVDAAGNRAQADVTINLDLTPPAIQARLEPATAWAAGPVTVFFDCVDALSGVEACTPAVTVEAEGAGQAVEGQAVDRAGHVVTTTAVVNIDRTPPTVTATLTPPPNAAGWHDGPVTVAFACADAGSGVASCPAPVEVTAEGAGQVISGEAVDAAGNRAQADVTINLDLTPPAVQARLEPATPWAAGPVTVFFDCVDALSGVEACTPAVTVQAEGAGQVVEGQAVDRAGHVVTTTALVSIDRTPPTIHATVTPAANAHGWHREPATVTFQCADSGSGVAGCPAPQTIATEGAARAVSGQARDLAGNTADASVTVSLDLTPPVLAVTSPAPGTVLRTPGTVLSGSIADALSGIETLICGAAPAAISGGTFSCGVTLTEGPNTVTVIAIDTAGNEARVELPLSLETNTAPIARAGGPYAAETGQPIRFDGTTSSDPDGDPISFAWTFGDGGTATGASPSHGYAAPGTYSVELTVRDSQGASTVSTTTATVTLANRAPTASAGGPYTGDVARPIVFDASASIDPDGDILTYAWTFGDGTAGTGVSAQRAYATAGTFTVQLTVDDGRGGRATATAIVTVRPINQRPTASVGGPYAGETSVPLVFDATQSSDPDGDPLTYAWSFGDGGIGAGATPAHVFLAAGTFTVTLTVTDGRGGSHSASTQVPVRLANQVPSAVIDGPATGDTRAALTFDGAGSTDPDGDPLTYAWAFGDGRSASGPTTTHTFASAGAFTVTLTVRDGRGGTAVASLPVTVAEAPAVNRTPVANAGGPYDAEVGLPLAFDGSASSDPDGDALTWAWDFGDGSAGTGPAPAHAYAEARQYTVVLTVTDSQGASNTATATVTVGLPLDRAPPVVTLAGPRFVLPATRVVVRASASDNVGVAALAFEVNGAPDAPLAAPPYEREIAVPAVASPGDVIAVRAVARDAAGNSAAAGIALTIAASPDLQAPVVSLRLPPQAAAGTVARFTAIASDDDGVAGVTFSVDGTALVTVTDAPFEAAFTVPADAVVGSAFQITAEAADFTGNRQAATGALVVGDTPDTTPPAVHLTAPATVLPGGAILLSASVTDDSGIGAVEFYVDGARVATLLEAPYEASYPVPASAIPGMTFRSEVRAMDLAGLEATDAADTRLALPSVNDGLVVGEVYDDATGLPIADATVRLSRAGVSETVVTDERGRYFLRAADGDATLEITAPGYTNAARVIVVSAGLVTEPLDARLTPLDPTTAEVVPVFGGEVSAGFARLSVPAGAVGAPTTLRLTPVGPQGLMAPLPAGWSPVAAVDVAPRGLAFAVPATLRVTPAGASADGTILTLVAWDETARAWRAIAVAPSAAALEADVPASGQYVWIRPDQVPAAPLAPAPGDLVAGVPSSAVPADAVATIAPEPRVVFYQPGVRSDVGGALVTTAPLSSGARLWARFSETYRFLSGAQIQPEPSVQDLTFYQDTADGLRLGAAYPATPSLAFDPLALDQGSIGVEMWVPPAGGEPRAMLSPAGGSLVTASGDRFDLPAGAVASAVAGVLRRLAPDELGATMPAGLELVAAVDLELSGAALSASGVLSVPRPPSVADLTQLLLVRVATLQDRTRLVLVGLGRLEPDRIVSEAILPRNRVPMEGVRAGGRYAFVRAQQPVGFFAGHVLGPTGATFDGALVDSHTVPVVSLSRGGDGTYVSAAAVGSAVLDALDMRTSDRGTGAGELTAAGDEAALDLRLVPEPPRVVAVTPAAGARNVPLSSTITVQFSEPIDPATITGAAAGNALLTGPAGGVVPGAISLGGGNTLLTFRPAASLDSDTEYRFTLAAAISDVSGYTLGTPLEVTFTSVNTTAPLPPPAGSLSASIPDADGNTTVRGAQGTAGLHDTVSIENVTRGTSTPVLVDPNGGFVALVKASAGDRLRLKVTDEAGHETLVDLPGFVRQNADGSVSGVIGSAGGRVDGPDGTAVEVPAGSLPDGTIVTIQSVSEADFPVQLSAEDRQTFGFAGGVHVDFGGVTPSRYVNVSVPPQAGDTADDQWIVAQAIEIDGQTVLNTADTAHLIDGRVRTSSPPCPGVLAQGTYGIYKSSQPVGLAFGRMYAGGSYDGLRLSVSFVMGASIALPFPVYAWEDPLPICLPAITGRITVGQNTVRIALAPDALTTADREIVVKNLTAGNEAHFRRDVLEYAVDVPGAGTDTYRAAVVSTAGVETPVTAIDVKPASAGRVRVTLDADSIAVSVTEIVVRNTSRTPVVEVRVPRQDLVNELPVPGGLTDNYWVTVTDADGVSRPLDSGVFTVQPSAYGPGTMLARALDGTIDPSLDEIVAKNGTLPPDQQLPTTKYRTRVDLIAIRQVPDGPDPDTLPDEIIAWTDEIPADRIVNGAFAFAFDGESSDDYAVEVRYNTGETEYDRIRRLRLVVQNPISGRVIKTIELPAPPKDEPIGVGVITDDSQPPMLTSSPPRLGNFDPATALTFTFSESMNADSVKQGAIVERVVGGVRQKVAGTWRISNLNRTATFVPESPLRVAQEYSITFVGRDGLASSLAPGVQPITDFGGNALPTVRLQIRTFAPRIVGKVEFGSDGRPMDELRDMQIRRRTVAGQSQTLLFATTSADMGPKLLAFDVTDAGLPEELGLTYGGRFQKELVLVPDVGSNGNAPITFRQALPAGSCGGAGPTYTGDLAISAGANIDTSFVQVWSTADPEHPCMMASRLLTANPETLNSYTQPGTLHAQGFVPSVAFLRHTQGVVAYVAVREAGLFASDVGPMIPEPLPADRVRAPHVAGDYSDVVAVQDRLLATNYAGRSLDVFDAGLAMVASVSLPGEPRQVVVAERFGFDEDDDGFIRPNEVKDLAFVGTRSCPSALCTYTIQIVDLHGFDTPQVIGAIQLPGSPLFLDLDTDKQRLFVSGYLPGPTSGASGPAGILLIDVSRPTAFGADYDHDGLDDRIVWTQPFADGVSQVRVDKERGLLYVSARSATGVSKGRLEIWAIYDNCCDLGVTFTTASETPPTGDRAGLLNKEREALRTGIAAGLAKAQIECGLSPTGISILEQGSGACLWRSQCDANYQPGLSDHDFELFLPDAEYDQLVNGVKRAVCAARQLNEVFQDPKTSRPIPIQLPGGGEMSFDDITFFPEVRERFESARFDVELPDATGTDTVGDMGLGRRSLMLKWLLEGAYVTGVPGYSVEGRSLDAILEDLKHVTGIPRLEGYEWATLQDYALAKSKAFLRITGASAPDSSFHKLFVKQLHDAGKAGIRATMARMVADPAGNQLVLDVTRAAYEADACLEMEVGAAPAGWRAKPCGSFEEYVASAAARSLRNGLGLFTTTQITDEVARFYRVKSDRERIVSETGADQFIARAALFVASVRATTQPVYAALLSSDPDAAQRASNVALALTKTTDALQQASLPLVPHVFNRGFRNASGVQLSMYEGDTPGAGTLRKTIAVDLAGGDDRQLDFVRDANGELALTNGRATPIFKLSADLSTGFSQPHGVSFTIDLPARTTRESNRQNNVGGFFYYVLDRSSGATPSVPGQPLMPLPDPALLDPSPECYDSPTLTTYQTVEVAGVKLGDQAVLGRGEAVKIYLTVQNLSGETVQSVDVCSNITNECYAFGALAPGASQTKTIDYVTPTDTDRYIDGGAYAVSPTTGVVAGPLTRLIVSGDAFAIQPLMDEAVVASIDPKLLQLQIGGTALRHYRIVGRRTGQPKPNLTVSAEIQGFFGSTVDTRALTFKTNARGELCTPGGSSCSSAADGPDIGLQVPYDPSMVDGTTYFVTLKKVDGKDLAPENHTAFQFDLVDRTWSQSYAVGSSLEGTLQIGMFGGEGSEQRGLELSKEGGFVAGATKLTVGLSTEVASKSSAEFSLLPNLETAIGVGELNLEAKASNAFSEGQGDGKEYGFTYVPNADPTGPPRILDFPQQCALATVTLGYVSGSNPFLNKILDLIRTDHPCGDPSPFLTGRTAELSRSATDAASTELSFKTPLKKGADSKLNVKFGVGGSATTGFTVKHESKFEADASGTPAVTETSEGYKIVGKTDYSAGLSSSYAPEDPKDDAVVVEKFKKAMSANLAAETRSSGAYEVSFTYKPGANRPASVSISHSQPKAFGWTTTTGGGSGAVNLGSGLPTTKISFTLKRAEDVDAAIARLSNVEAIQKANAQAELTIAELDLQPTQLNKELGTFRGLLPSVVAAYDIGASDGTGIEVPFGLKGKWLGIGLGAKFAVKGDAKTSYTVERGVVYKGLMLPLQRYARDAYLPVTDLSLADVIGTVWDALETSLAGPITAMSANITLSDPAVELRSPNTAIMTINGTAEPEPFQADLYSYKFRPITTPLPEGHLRPTDTAGLDGQPHYGIGGFHHFSPEGRVLAAPAGLVIDYHDEETVGLDESTFAIYAWNDDTEDWDYVGGVVDPNANTVTTTVDRLRLYTVAPSMPARTIALTAVDQGATGTDEKATRRFVVTSGPLVTNDGQPVPDGTLYSVRALAGGDLTADFGTVLTADADATRERVQVPVVGGHLQFEVEYPAPNGSFVPGRIVAYSVAGTAFGSVTTTLGGQQP